MALRRGAHQDIWDVAFIVTYRTQMSPNYIKNPKPSYLLPPSIQLDSVERRKQMARQLYRRLPLASLFSKFSQSLGAPAPVCLEICHLGRRNSSRFWVPLMQASRSYARDRSNYNLFGSRIPGDQEFRKAWAEEVDDEDCLWTGSDEDDAEDNAKHETKLQKEIRKAKIQAKENSDLIDADDSDELRSLCSESDEEVNLWSGSECDDDDDIPAEPHPNERSDPHIDKLFEFEETPKYRTLADMLKEEEEPPELSPGKQARKLAVENALKKLKKGPDGRYINVWEVMSDIDILIGAFDNIVSGPEYAELREGGPKKLNMQFFKDIQARMRDPNYKFSPELKLKPKSKLVPKKKWQKAQSRKRKNERR